MRPHRLRRPPDGDRASGGTDHLPGARPFALLRRLGWGVADQGVSSMGNLVLGIVVARTLGAQDFGAFSLAFVTFSFLLSASRGASTDPLLVRFGGGEPDWSKAVAAATGTALATGLLTGLGCILLGLWMPASIGPGFVALGVGLPGILLQDSYRFAFFAQGRGDKAFVNDVVWAVLQISAVVALLMSGHATAVTCLLAFGGTATVAAALGLLQSGIRPRLSGVRSWLVTHSDLGGRYLVENVSIGGARQVRIFAVGALAGLAAVGEIRAAEILMGPFLVVLSGLSQVAVPETREVLLSRAQRLGRFCLWLGAIPAAAALVWAAVLLIVLPRGLGSFLLGSLWEPTATLIIPMTGILMVACFHNACAAGVRALGASRRSLTAQLWNAALYASAGSIGAEWNGALGSTWGVLLGSLLGTFIWWYQLRAGLSEHEDAARPVAAVR